MTLKFAREHRRLHQLAGAKDHEAGNYKLFHSNGSGALVELSLGEIGEVLTAQGPAAAPEFESIKADNIIINGDFHFWQRKAPFLPLANGKYGADRFSVGLSTGALNVYKETSDVPSNTQSGHLSPNALWIVTATADTSLATTDYAAVRYKMEGYDFVPLYRNKAVLSFWVKTNKPGTYCVSFVCGGWDSSYVTEYTVNASNTWEKKSVNVTFQDSIGTWYYETGIGLDIHFTLAGGSGKVATKETWTGDHYVKTSAMNVNFLDSTANYIKFSQIKMEPGETVTPFKDINVAEEFARCQRYFEKSYSLWDDIGDYPVYNGCGIIEAASAKAYVLVGFQTQKRVEPTVVTYSPESPGTSGVWYDWDANAEDSSGLNANKGTRGFYASNSSSIDQHLYGFHWTAEAEL